jgi:hypothetical protein
VFFEERKKHKRYGINLLLKRCVVKLYHHQIDIALSKDGDAHNLSREERIARGTQDEDHDAAGGLWPLLQVERCK